MALNQVGLYAHDLKRSPGRLQHRKQVGDELSYAHLIQTTHQVPNIEALLYIDIILYLYEKKKHFYKQTLNYFCFMNLINLNR